VHHAKLHLSLWFSTSHASTQGLDGWLPLRERGAMDGLCQHSTPPDQHSSIVYDPAPQCAAGGGGGSGPSPQPVASPKPSTGGPVTSPTPSPSPGQQQPPASSGQCRTVTVESTLFTTNCAAGGTVRSGGAAVVVPRCARVEVFIDSKGQSSCARQVCDGMPGGGTLMASLLRQRVHELIR
jgi:hypothetical protein